MLESGQNALDLALGGIQLGGSGVVRQGNLDMADVVFVLLLTLFLQDLHHLLHFLLGDVDTAAHLVAAHLVHQDLAANLFPILGIGHPFTGELGPQLIQGHLVVGSDALNSLFQLGVADLQPLALRQLQLQALLDQPIQRLFAQGGVVRQGLAALLSGEFYLVDQCVLLAGQHHVLVDHGQNLIHQLGRSQCGLAHGTEHSRGQQGNQGLFHIHLSRLGQHHCWPFRLNGRT